MLRETSLGSVFILFLVLNMYSRITENVLSERRTRRKLVRIFEAETGKKDTYQLRIVQYLYYFMLQFLLSLRRYMKFIARVHIPENCYYYCHFLIILSLLFLLLNLIKLLESRLIFL